MQKKHYQTRSEGQTSRRNKMDRSEEDRAQWVRDKANSRATRAKQARVVWDKELTELVTKEAHELRRIRNAFTGFEWHVDHILPLKGVEVCGLHVWNNLQVIPKHINLKKGNKHALYAQRKEGLQT